MKTRLGAGGIDRADALTVALIAALWIGMIVAVNPIGDFPLNDDWLYGGSVKSLLSGDGFHAWGAVRGPTIGNILTQVLWGAAFCLPFGFSYTALRISTLVLGFIGLACFFALLRENGLSRRIAAVATVTLAVNPFYAGLGESFMTDVPVVAMMIVSLYFLTRSLREDSTRYLLAGVLLSFVAILTKQIGFAPLLGYAAANAVKQRSRIGASIAGAIPLVLGVGLYLAFRHWLLATGRTFFIEAQIIPLDPVSLASWSFRCALYALPYVGFALFPIVAITGVLPRSILAARSRYIGWTCVAAGCAAVLAFLWLKGDQLPSLGNIITRWGMGPLTQRDTYLLKENLPPTTDALTAFWFIATACGAIGIVAFVTIGCVGVWTRVVEVSRGRADRNDWLWIAAAFTGIGYWVTIVVLSTQTGEFFDRYVLPILPVAMIVLTTGDAMGGNANYPAWRGGATAVLLLVAGGLSVAAAHDYLAWNRTRWVAVNYLTETIGARPTDFDGGYEVNGRLVYTPGDHGAPGKSWWWVHDDKYLLATAPIAGYEAMKSFPVPNRYLPVGLQQVVILRRTNTGG